MGAREPIPLRGKGEQYGRRAGTWVRQVRERMARGRELAAAARQFWREIQAPEGKQRHLMKVLALALGAGVLLGLLSGRRTG